MDNKNSFSKMIDVALSIIPEAHNTQTDKAGLPYQMHPLAVATGFAKICAVVPPNKGILFESGYLAALLHDVVEDSDITLLDLRERGFNAETLIIVDALTKRDDEEYFAYINDIVNRQDRFQSTIAAVKLADLMENTSSYRDIVMGNGIQNRDSLKYSNAKNAMRKILFK